LDENERNLAATAYRRSGMSWKSIAQHLRVDKDLLREAIKAEGREDGYAEDDPLKPEYGSLARRRRR
jgi:transposase